MILLGLFARFFLSACLVLLASAKKVPHLRPDRNGTLAVGRHENGSIFGYHLDELVERKLVPKPAGASGLFRHKNGSLLGYVPSDKLEGRKVVPDLNMTNFLGKNENGSFRFIQPPLKTVEERQLEDRASNRSGPLGKHENGSLYIMDAPTHGRPSKLADRELDGRPLKFSDFIGHHKNGSLYAKPPHGQSGKLADREVNGRPPKFSDLIGQHKNGSLYAKPPHGQFRKLAERQLVVPTVNSSKFFGKHKGGSPYFLGPSSKRAAEHKPSSSSSSSKNFVDPYAWTVPEGESANMLAASCSDGDKLAENVRGLCKIRVPPSKMVTEEESHDENEDDDGDYGFAYLNPTATFPSQVGGRLLQVVKGLEPGRAYAFGLAVSSGGDLQKCSVGYSVNGAAATGSSGFVAGEFNYRKAGRGSWHHFGPVDVDLSQAAVRDGGDDDVVQRPRDVQRHGKHRKGDLLEIRVSCPYFPTFPTGYLAITDVQLVEKTWQ